MALMKHLVVLGAGTAGTIVANRVRQELPRDWSVTVVDPSDTHLYQPGLLFLPFGAKDEAELVHLRGNTLCDGVEWARQGVRAIEPEKRRVVLEEGNVLEYDLLVVATGSQMRPELTRGLVDSRWQQSICDFYTLSGALALRDILARFERGRLVVNLVELPVKWPIAALEFAFLADDFFQRRKVRDQVEIVLATPLESAFSHPVAARVLRKVLERKGIRLETEFATSCVDDGRNRLHAYDGRSLDFDLLVPIPTHTGADCIEQSGLGDELGFMPTDRRTLRARGHTNIFVIGDATDVPTSKAGSVAHFEADGLVPNLLRWIDQKPLEPAYDGHANCFLETGRGKGMLLDFNYDVEPLPGRYPLPALGPFSLLEESRINHLGKLAFRWVYFNGLLSGKPMPMATQLSMVGKRVVELNG
ncbi:MAG: FAD/NAD(P)-binding oxidoreductase [Polyangiaceae bacterium]